MEEQAKASGTALQEIAAKGEKLKTGGDNISNAGTKKHPVSIPSHYCLCIQHIGRNSRPPMQIKTQVLELFLRDLLLNETHPLHNRTWHISGTFKETEKPDIGTGKPDIEALKADIEKKFQAKTVSHILKLREVFPGQAIFGRSDVMNIIDIKPSRASDLLREMVEQDVIESVTGHGKGKYRFRLNKG